MTIYLKNQIVRQMAYGQFTNYYMINVKLVTLCRADLKMNMRNMIAVICFAFSCNVFAKDASPVLFDQVLNLKPNQSYEITLNDVQAGDQIWTAVYLVGRQNYPGPTSKIDFVINNQGLLNKNNANEHSIKQQLIAENLKQTDQYSFNQFKGLKTLIDEISVMMIEDPVLEKTDTVRIYSQVNDWIPEYNSYEQTKVQFSVQNPMDFDIVAAYVLVGKGAKPAQLSELDFKSIAPTYVTDTSAGASPTVQVTTQNAPMAVPLGTESGQSESHLSKFEMKIVIFMVVVAVMTFLGFINRRKFKRAY